MNIAEKAVWAGYLKALQMKFKLGEKVLDKLVCLYLD